MNSKIAIFAALVSVLGLAATTTTTPATTATPATTSTEQVSTSTANWFGMFELRPTYGSKVGQFTTENTAEAGYKFNKDAKLYYSQWFNTNLYTPGVETTGMNLEADEGALRYNVNNIWTSGDTSLSWQVRLHTPTKSSMRDAGFITNFRNYLKLAQKVNDTVSVDFSLAPWLYVYDRAGSGNNANPIFNQRFILNADLKFTDSLTLSVPLIADFTRFRDYSNTAALNNSWGYTVWAWPELAYTINDTYNAGLAYRSDSFIAVDGSQSTVGEGFEKGVFQIFWNANL